MVKYRNVWLRRPRAPKLVTAAKWQVADIGGPRTPTDEYVSSRVWFTLRGIDFPETGWHDDPLPTLSTAAAAYESIRDGEPEAFSYFFDGPYFLYYRRIDTSPPTVYIEGNCDGDPDDVFSVTTGEMLLEELRHTLYEAARVLHAEIADKKHIDTSVQLAADLVDRLSLKQT
ncbi:hypothetical protein FB565_007538 [Actinoplanes lutulentus]|uniref:Uncharacterized protein n=1 Tax=Actinoplanes lutulentus TaxID=1287878 RepID=A0A327Z3L5_9ACTN|nr:hypothetical protein [Actinoplanes lutulentus]MBB2947767.1 hypothetical protein [Actinoplanes lutulentus]RAK29919.1 hypothetical protein B0I29_117245 [Actinoplanes lutulentus]